MNKFLATAILGACCTLMTAADDAPKAAEDGKPGKFGKFAGKIDKAKIFEKMDADGDGKLTKDEFKTMTERMMERFKDKLPGGGAKAGQFAEKRFESMDTNKDGTISKEEFEKSAGFGPPGGFKGKSQGKRPGAPKPEDK